MTRRSPDDCLEGKSNELFVFDLAPILYVTFVVRPSACARSKGSNAMTWFADLTPYVYGSITSGTATTVNIGWLRHGRVYPTGDAPVEFVERLKELTELASVQQTRGFHECDLCSQGDHESRAHGSSEVRAVGANGIRYAAPSLVYHYVAVHGYRPPQGFVDAVLRAAHVTWEVATDGDLCLSCGSKLRRVQSQKGWTGATRRHILSVQMACDTCGEDYHRTFPDTDT
jgi:hypothetical protein